MTAQAAITDRMSAADRAHHRARQILCDLAMVAVLVTLSCGGGLRNKPFFLASSSGLSNPGAALRSGADDAGGGGAVCDRTRGNRKSRRFPDRAENKSALILDARPAVFIERGHVPGALNLSRDDFANDIVASRPRLKTAQAKPIIVYCSGGECHDSRLVANALLSLGFSNVSLYPGGWEEWSAAIWRKLTGKDSMTTPEHTHSTLPDSRDKFDPCRSIHLCGAG